eukprot:scaffold43380_cov66-Phaeocystis_antarctica.AAC.7
MSSPLATACGGCPSNEPAHVATTEPDSPVTGADSVSVRPVWGAQTEASAVHTSTRMLLPQAIVSTSSRKLLPSRRNDLVVRNPGVLRCAKRTPTMRSRGQDAVPIFAWLPR